GQLTITKHPHGCLMIFPRPAWEQFRDRIAALPMQAQWWRRIFLGNAMDLEMDGSGRVLVSPELRADAGITRESILLRMGSYLELWDAQTYAAKEAEAKQAEMPDVLNDFSFGGRLCRTRCNTRRCCWTSRFRRWPSVPRGIVSMR